MTTPQTTHPTTATGNTMMDKTELRRIKRHLMSWSTGQFEVGPANQDSCSTIVVADPAHLADLLDTDLVGDNTVVLAPEGHGADPSRVVGFAGTLDDRLDDHQQARLGEGGVGEQDAHHWTFSRATLP